MLCTSSTSTSGFRLCQPTTPWSSILPQFFVCFCDFCCCLFFWSSWRLFKFPTTPWSRILPQALFFRSKRRLLKFPTTPWSRILPQALVFLLKKHVPILLEHVSSGFCQFSSILGVPRGLGPIWTRGLFGPNDLCLDRRRIFLPGYKFLPGCLDTFARILPGYNPPVSTLWELSWSGGEDHLQTLERLCARWRCCERYAPISEITAEYLSAMAKN